MMEKLDVVGEYLTVVKGHPYVWSNRENWIKPAEESTSPELSSADIDAVYKDALIWVSWRNVRITRDQLLKQCDWTQVPDAPVDQEAWKAYRQALRDITSQPDPFNISWPLAPNQGA